MATIDWLQMAREAFSTSTTFFDASIRRTVEQNIRQFQGVHPSGSKYHADSYKSRSRFFRPKTRATIRKNEAVASEAFFSTKDVVSIDAEHADDPVQRASAELMKHLLQYRLKKSIPWFQLVLGAYQDSQTVGVCISHQYWAYDKKRKIDKPCVELIPIENLRIDPSSDWTDPINSSPYNIRMIPMYVKDVKAKMRAIDTKTNAPKWKTLDDSRLLTAMNMYGDTTRLTRERGRTDSKEQSQTIRDFAIVWVHQNIINVDGIDFVYYTLGTTDLLSDPRPLEEVYFHGKRPFVMGCCILETHKTYPAGVAEITKDTQGEINEIANQRIDNVKFALNKRYFVKRNAQVDLRSITRNVPGSVTMMNDPEKDVVIQSTPDVTASSYQEQDRLNLDFDDVAGTFSQSSVSSNRKLNETVGGMEMLSSDANQVGNLQLRTFVKTWMEPVLHQLVLLEQYYETDTVVFAMAGKKAQLMQRFGVDAITDELLMSELTLNVNVGIGATNPTQQVNQFMLAMTNLRNLLADGLLEKYGLDIQEVIKELFGKLGYEDGARFFNTEEQDPRITAMQATIQQLQQELSQKVSPELVAAQVKKIDAEIEHFSAKTKDVIAAMVKKGVEASFASMQAGEVVAAIPQVAPIADKIMEAAGYQVPLGGQDPNFPTGEPAPGLGIEAVKNKRTGISFMPGAAGDTSPNTPASPETPGVGAMQGIETMQADSIQ